MRSLLSKAVELGGYGTLSIVALMLGFVHGVQTDAVTLTAPFVTIRATFIEAVPSAIAFTAFALFTGGLLVAEVFRPRDPDAAIEEGPPMTAIVPVYRDHEVLEQSVLSLRESNYADLEVLIVCEPDDERTLDEAEQLAGIDGVECIRNRQPGSKAGAINDAVRRVDTEYFAVFDADEVIDPDFVPKAAHSLHEEGNDVFQGRRVPRPSGWIETLAYCERVVFHASYKIVELTGFRNCRSSSTAFTREAFEAVGGYDDLLTEDLAFAHACYRQGLDVEQARNYTNQMEAPHTLRDLWCQRKRWRTGQIEVLHETLRALPSAEHPGRTLVSIGRMLSSLLGTLFLLTLTAKFVVLLLADLELLFAVPLASVLAVVLAVACRDAIDGQAQELRPSVLLTPLLFPAFGLLTIKCALEYAFTWDGTWYRVQKTGA